MLALAACKPSAPPTAAAPSDNAFHIAVMLQFSGTGDRHVQDTFHWATDNINAAGGPTGRKVVVDLIDTQQIATVDLKAYSERYAKSINFAAAIGPQISSEATTVIPPFIDAKRPIVTPYAAASSLTSQFGGKKYFWRTVLPVTAEMKFLLLWLKKNNLNNVGLVTTDDAFGASWFDYFGFTATEIGLTVKGLERQFKLVKNPDVDCTTAVEKVLKEKPAVVILAFPIVADLVCAIKHVRAKAPTTKILIADTLTQAVIDEVGYEQMSGIVTDRGMSPNNGFDEAYLAKFNKPNDAAGQAYDAVLLIALGLQRSKGVGGEALANAMHDIVQTRGGEKTSWDVAGIARAFKLIEEGTLPDIGGATGSLKYDPKIDTDPLEESVTISEFVSESADAGSWKPGDVMSNLGASGTNASSAALQFATLAKTTLLRSGTSRVAFAPARRTGLKVLLVQTSTEFENYRHQSDVLQMYRILLAQGVDPKDIILVLSDDIVKDPRSEGKVTQTPDGPDLYRGAKIDYELHNLKPQNLIDILSGKETQVTPTVLHTTETDNIFVFFSGHGGRSGVYMGAADAKDPGSNYLTPELLKAGLDGMREANKFRLALFIVEACESGVLLEGVTATGTIIITAASDIEQSFSASWNPVGQFWHADTASMAFFRLINTAPGLHRPIADFWGTAYDEVTNSHVQIANYSGTDITTTTLREFISP